MEGFGAGPCSSCQDVPGAVGSAMAVGTGNAGQLGEHIQQCTQVSGARGAGRALWCPPWAWGVQLDATGPDVTTSIRGKQSYILFPQRDVNLAGGMEQTQWESCCPGLCLLPQLVGAVPTIFPRCQGLLDFHGTRHMAWSVLRQDVASPWPP